MPDARDARDARDACVRRLSDLLKANDGIEASHLPEMDGKSSGQICIHYDPDRFSIRDVRELARRAGAELEKRFGHLLLKREPMHARQSLMVESRAKKNRWGVGGRDIFRWRPADRV